MIVKNNAFAGAWEDWCDGSYSNDPAQLTKCKSKPLGPLSLAPWTDVGAAVRGITKPTSSPAVGQAASGIFDTIAALFSPGGSAPSESGPVMASVGGVPKGLLYGGLALLGVGAAATLLSSRGKKRRR